MKEFIGRLTFPGLLLCSTSLRRSSTDLFTYASMSTTGTWSQAFVNSLNGLSSFAIFNSGLALSFFDFLVFVGFGGLPLLCGNGLSGLRVLLTAKPLLVRMVSLGGVDIDGVGGEPAGVPYWFEN